jgi:predicted dehydrogenase
VRAAIVGAGMMGEWHARAARDAGATIALVVDPDESRGSSLAGRFAGARWSADPDSVADEKVQSAHICTPLAEHESSVERAIRAGVNCLVEKPLSVNATSTERLLNLARDGAVVLCPSHQYLYQRGVMEALAAVGGIGPLRHCLAVCCTAGAQAGVDPSSLAADILPHHLAVFRRIKGDGFASLSWRAMSSGPGELSAWASDGITAFSIVVSTGGRPTRNEVELIGENGTVSVDLFHGFSVRSAGQVSRASKAARPLVRASTMLAAAAFNLGRRAVAGETAFPGLRELVKRYYTSLRHSSPAPVSANETVDVAIARDAILHALAG